MCIILKREAGAESVCLSMDSCLHTAWLYSLSYSVSALNTKALHNDQSFRDATAWLQPAIIIIIITFEVLTIPQPCCLHGLPHYGSTSFSVSHMHTQMGL